ncbi:MAG: hypothetical protein JW395_3600 [Nitrospira sp.]|nr:hypothetical protein [Nitrospira sp.]
MPATARGMAGSIAFSPQAPSCWTPWLPQRIRRRIMALLRRRKAERRPQRRRSTWAARRSRRASQRRMPPAMVRPRHRNAVPSVRRQVHRRISRSWAALRSRRPPPGPTSTVLLRRRETVRRHIPASARGPRIRRVLQPPPFQLHRATLEWRRCAGRIALSASGSLSAWISAAPASFKVGMPAHEPTRTRTSLPV